MKRLARGVWPVAGQGLPSSGYSLPSPTTLGAGIQAQGRVTQWPPHLTRLSTLPRQPLGTDICLLLARQNHARQADKEGGGSGLVLASFRAEFLLLL